jgi:L-ascorbate metabolism protein UlaG (beta-lactamase superfamily)
VETALKVLFVGTGAADWACTYEATVEEAAVGAVRGMSAILVNGRILIDCGGTVPEALALFGADASGITDLLVTHTHGDHLNPAALQRLLEARGQAAPLRVWIESGGVERLPELDGIEVHSLQAGQAFDTAGLSATPLAANHVVRPPEQPLHYLLKCQGRRVFYATDGAWLFRETWLRLRELELDGIIWDATNGETEGDWRIFEHNSVDMIRLMMQTLRREGIATPDTRVRLTHMARALCAPHEEMHQRLGPEGLVPAHDGLVMTWTG